MRMKFPILLIAIIFALFVIESYAGEDYYKILNIQRNADTQTIKKSFKKLSLKYHPDKNKGKEDWARD